MTSLPGWAEPMYATQRNPKRETWGHRLAHIAEELGTPFMAWQRHVADVGLEINPETGRLAYREIVVSVMRQNGKTQLVLCAECARCLMWGSEQRVAYSAQTGAAARQKFKEDQLPEIQRSPLKMLVYRPYLSDGNTALVWKNGSRISVLDNTPTAGHGKTLDLAIIDEAFSDKDSMREQALLPTMATRLNPQLWNVSTAGTSASTYLRRKVDMGRAAVTAGDDTGVAYFEWGIPEDEDVDDPAIWAKRMPALGVTVNEEYIRHARQTMPDGEYRRAIGNQWTETEERLIPAAWWHAISRFDVRSAGTVFAIDARADRSEACVVKADRDGNLEIVKTGDGITWLVEDLKQHVDKSIPLVIDKYGPAAVIADEMIRANHNVVFQDSIAVRQSCGRFYDAIADQTLHVRSDDRIDAAVKNATNRTTADSWAWHREAPGGEILMALSLAYAYAATNPPWEPMVSWA